MKLLTEMKIAHIIYICLFFGVICVKAGSVENGPRSGKVRIKGNVTPGYQETKIELTLSPILLFLGLNKDTVIQESVVKGKVNISLEIQEPVLLRAGDKGSLFGYEVFGSQGPDFLLEAGDQIEITYKNNVPVFSGIGAAKFDLIYKLRKTLDSSFYAYKSKFKIHYAPETPESQEEYFYWNKLSNENIKSTDHLLESFKGKISNYAFDQIKARTYDLIELRRAWQFKTLSVLLDRSSPTKHRFGLSNKDLCRVYDTTMNSRVAKWLQYESPVACSGFYLYHITRLDLDRKRQQFFPDEKGKTFLLGSDKAEDRIIRYQYAKDKFNSSRRDALLSYMFQGGDFFGDGFNPQIENILHDFYTSSVTDPRYHQSVKLFESKMRLKLRALSPINEFTLTDIDGKSYTRANSKNKVVLFHLWSGDSDESEQMGTELSQIVERFKNNKDVTFLSVSVDQSKEQWMKNIFKGKNIARNSQQLFTNGEGNKHSLIRNYGISEYPSLLFLDAYGNAMRIPVNSDPRADGGKFLIQMIEKELVRMKDGPYVFEEKGVQTAYNINGNQFIKSTPTRLTVQTDQYGKTFKISLQKSLSIPASEFSSPEKLFALSDIEGNFDKFRLLLQNNKIIDADYNWTFGNGHLVFTGDMFDRGEQVTECLWLIYSLEEKAKAAGGQVHFILGNHEVMNLQGNFRYVKVKYKTSASALDKTILQLYDKNTELGKWLRTKNVVEQIGDLLFVHGGLSSKINQSALTIADINKLARPYYDRNLGEGKYPNENTNLVMSQSFGPFWYRGYYSGNGNKRVKLQPTVDSLLTKYNAKHIITGHTIFADKITALYNNKVINTDVAHAKGNSEALLIEGKNFYRVTYKGEKFLLFKED